MNLYLRLFITMLTARFKSQVPIMGPLESTHRVWPNDLDVFMHMNNGRYFTIADLARMELLVRAGLWKKMKPLGYYPVMAGETAQFRGSLLPLQKYTIVTRVIGWDERFIYLEQAFKTGDTVCALLIVKTRFLGKAGKRVSPQEMIELSGNDHVEAIRMDEVLKQWNDSTLAHWQQLT